MAAYRRLKDKDQVRKDLKYILGQILPEEEPDIQQAIQRCWKQIGVDPKTEFIQRSRPKDRLTTEALPPLDESRDKKWSICDRDNLVTVVYGINDQQRTVWVYRVLLNR